MRTFMVRSAAFFALAGALLASPAPAAAQAFAAYVNGDPISWSEVDQRIRVNRVARHPATSRAAALNELIDDRVKLIEARRIGYMISDSHMDEQIQRIAKSNNQTLFEFHQNMSKVGIDMNAYRQKLKAAYAWDLLIEKRQKGSDGSSFDSIFQNSSTGYTGRIYDYTLHSIIFVVPRGASAGSRIAEANGARARFGNCESGLAMLRGMRDVAVKSSVRRSSDGLSPELNKILEATPVNRMTQAFPSPQGVESIAVCEKTLRPGTANRVADDPRKKQADAAAYLKELRSRAVIQRR